ncbi:hypothetical protein [Modestobacter lapidis]|nr:hypothetical protein [Modestobacter lapidis]
MTGPLTTRRTVSAAPLGPVRGPRLPGLASAHDVTAVSHAAAAVSLAVPGRPRVTAATGSLAAAEPDRPHRSPAGARPARRLTYAMLIDKSHVLQTLRTRGMTEQAARAEQVLDAHVDTVRDADLLRSLGIDPDSRAEGGGLATR